MKHAEHPLQVLGDPCSSAALQLLGYTSAAQRAAGVSCLVLHALVRLLRPEDRLATGERHAYPRADRVRVFTREGEDVGQEEFNALVHRVFGPYRLSSLADSPSPPPMAMFEVLP